VEREHSLAQAQVARRPGFGAREMPGEKPVRAPLAQSPQRRDPRLDLVVRQQGQLVEVEVGAGHAEHVLGLAAGEAERSQLVLSCTCDTLRSRKRDGVLGRLAEALDETT